MTEGGGMKFCMDVWGKRAFNAIQILVIIWLLATFVIPGIPFDAVKYKNTDGYFIYNITHWCVVGALGLFMMVDWYRSSITVTDKQEFLKKEFGGYYVSSL